MVTRTLDKLTDIAIFAGGIVSYIPLVFFGWCWWWGIWVILRAGVTHVCW